MEQAGLTYEVHAPDIPEVSLDNETPVDFVRRLSLEKATHILKQRELEKRESLPVLGADTVVVSGGEVLGKPTDRDDAKRMLKSLSNRSHEVFTGISLVTESASWTRIDKSTVTFCKLTDADIEIYLNTGESYDKAGAYGIQGIAGLFVERLEGSYSGVMGLPLHELRILITESGLVSV